MDKLDLFGAVLVLIFGLGSGFLFGSGQAPTCSKPHNPLAYVFADYVEAEGIAEQIPTCVGIARVADGWILEHCE